MAAPLLHNGANNNDGFAAFNAGVDAEMNVERQAATEWRANLIYNPASAFATLPSTPALVGTAALPSLTHAQPSASGPASPGRLSMSKPCIQTAVCTAAFTFAMELPEVLAKPAPERSAAWARLLKQVAIAGGAGAVLGTTWKHIEKFLSLYTGPILNFMATNKKCAFIAAVTHTPFNSTVAAVGAVSQCVSAFWHSFLAWVSGNRHDQTSETEHWEKAKEAVSLDNVIRTLTAAASSAILAKVGAASGLTDPVGVVLLICVYAVVQGITESLLTTKSVMGGWRNWAIDVFVTDRRDFVWDGELFRELEDAITPNLKCTISHNIVHNPVRSTFTGHIYERAAIYDWLKRVGTDPLARVPATRLDFIPAPVARFRAHQFARHCQAQAVAELW